MYSLNVCNWSGTFEKSFGLTNFTKDYICLIVELNNSFNFINGAKYIYMTEAIAASFNRAEYRLFCKLSHFFDDFNFFINESVRTRTEHDSKHSVDRRLQDFIRRVKSMKIPQQTQDTIAGFLKMQRAKAALVATRENSWLVHKLYIPNEYLGSLGAALNKEIEIGEDGLNRFDQTRAQLLQQLATTLQKFPYIRLGQLISNSLPKDTDIFYITDAKLIQLLKDFEAQHGLS